MARVFIILFMCLVLSGCKDDLYTKLPETEANKMLSVLAKSDIRADRVVAADGSYTLRVSGDDMARAIDALTALGYPRQTYRSMGEVFDGDGFIMSPTEERARLVYALSEELGRTISEIDGVVSARVHVVLPARDMLHRTATPAAASIFLRHGPLVDTKAVLPQIKMLVANAIEGLTYDNVSVVPLAVGSAQPTVPTTITEVTTDGGGTLILDAPAGGVAAGLGSKASFLGGLPDWLGTGVRPLIALLLLGYAAFLFRAFGPRSQRRTITDANYRRIPR